MPFITISEMTDRSNVPDREQVFELADTAIVSEPLSEFAAFVRLYSDEDCFVAFGEDPLAVRGSFPISCCDPAIVAASPGLRISAILMEPPAPVAEGSSAEDVGVLDPAARLNPPDAPRKDSDHDHD